jgi:soluble lytic murein transglycosylase
MTVMTMVPTFFLFFFTVLSSFWFVKPSAASDVDDLRYVAALQAFQQGNDQQFQRLFRQLPNHALTRYHLGFLDLEKRITRVSRAELKSYLDNYHPQTNLAKKLREKYLLQAREQGRFDDFQALYADTGNVDLACTFLHQQSLRSSFKQIYEKVKEIWLHGQSLPASCDPLFVELYADARFSESLLWERIRLAVAVKNINLAKALARKLSTQGQAWANVYIGAVVNPEVVLQLRRDSQNPYFQESLYLAMLTLAKKDPAEAYRLWPTVQRQAAFSSEEHKAILQEIAFQAARKDLPEAERLLRELPPGAMDKNTMEAYLRLLLAKNDWQGLATMLKKLDKNQQVEGQWAYWQGRALERLGRPSEAEAAYRLAAQERSYYGFLAADKVNLPYQFNDEPISKDSKRLNDFLQAHPEVKLALDLFRLGQTTLARQEWNALEARFTEEDYLVLAALAHREGLHDRAIAMVAKVRAFNDIGLRFPLAYRDEIERFSFKNGINPAWAFGIMRQESIYVPDIRSSAGATGLMQLMPATAQMMARKVGRGSNFNITDPETNIDLGTAYLANMLENFGGNYVLATAAYNAGPGRARAWQHLVELPADIWIERIPFQETRQYVKRVMEYMVVFEWQLNNGSYGRISERVNVIPPR